jgi:hypothetical protein
MGAVLRGSIRYGQGEAMTTDELVAMNNWKVYMKVVHNESRKEVLRSTYETLSLILPDPINRSTLAIQLFQFKQKEWRMWAEWKQQDLKGLFQ